MKCYDCPRRCGVDRTKDRGFCQESDKIRIAKIIENFMWEEPCISGEKGCLAIFFSGCNLRCSFCQNYDISHASKGNDYSAEEFKALLKSYDLSRFSSIDLITPTHFASALINALGEEQWEVPIVWNSSGYENEETIERLSSVVNVFLPDFKYFSQDLSLRLSGAKDYFEVAKKAIKKMRDIKPKNIFTSDGILQEGVLIRHLVLPGQAKDSFKVLETIRNEITDPYISVMSQFTPHGQNDLNRKLVPLEYKSVLAHAEKLGLNKGYLQEIASADENFIPNF